MLKSKKKYPAIESSIKNLWKLVEEKEMHWGYFDSKGKN